MAEQKIENVSVLEIGIDDEGRLYVKPENNMSPTIENHDPTYGFTWQEGNIVAFAQKPSEWSSYLSQYRELTSILAYSFGCFLVITESTKWVNVDDILKKQFTVSLVDNKWKFKTSANAGVRYLIKGIDVWEFNWIDIHEKFLAKDPVYFQYHVVRIYEINNGTKKIRFGAAEFSNSIWGIFLEV